MKKKKIGDSVLCVARFALCAVFLLCAVTACGQGMPREDMSASSAGKEPSAGQEVLFDSTAPVSKDNQDSMQDDRVDLAAPPVFIPQLHLSDEEINALPSVQEQWGPGVQRDERNRPLACVDLQERYGKYDAWFLKDDSNIYLTFDEGYENGYTPKILDALKEADVKAVFFVTMPYVKSEPELVQRMIDEGHVIGNHSVNHLNMTELSLEEAREEIMGLHTYVKEHFNYEMFLFRNPEGAISEKALAAAQSVGYQSTLWSFAYADWDPANQMEPSEALAMALDALHPGAIYLLHAVSSTNAAIVTDFVAEAQARGYSFVKWTR